MVSRHVFAKRHRLKKSGKVDLSTEDLPDLPDNSLAEACCFFRGPLNLWFFVIVKPSVIFFNEAFVFFQSSVCGVLT